MKEILISWKASTPIPSGDSLVRRIYRWGSYVGILWNKEWTVEQRTPVQETPYIEECSSVLRAAPPATVDDAWEETYIDHGDYQSVEGSLLQIRITSKNYKKQITTAIALGCPIDSSTLRMCEAMVRPAELVEETPVSSRVPQPVPRVPQPVPPVPQPVPLVPLVPLAPLVPLVPSQKAHRQPQEGRKQEGHKQEGRKQEGRKQEGRKQDGLPRDWKSVRSRPNGGAPRGRLAAAPVHRTLSVSSSGWLGMEE